MGRNVDMCRGMEKGGKLMVYSARSNLTYILVCAGKNLIFSARLGQGFCNALYCCYKVFFPMV